LNFLKFRCDAAILHGKRCPGVRRATRIARAALTRFSHADTVWGYLAAALMARIGTAMRAATARMLVLGLALFLTLQGAMASFAAVHSHSASGCDDHAPLAVNVDSGDSDHLISGHSHDHNAGVSHRHDGAAPVGHADQERTFDCCGWMCTAAIWQAGSDALPHASQRRANHFWHRAPPPGWIALGLERPPRSHHRLNLS
jgi:hypothetical protein